MIINALNMLKTNYKRLCLEEREEISRGLAASLSLRDIAINLGRSPSTISREVNSRSMRWHNYRAARGEWQTRRRRSLFQGRKHKLLNDVKLRKYVMAKLLLRWSPVQIAQRIKMEYPDDKNMRISPETIYAHLYVLPVGKLRKTMLACLRRQQKFRRKKGKLLKDMRGILPNMVSIEERPEEAADRIIPGHWEGDLIMGMHKQSALGTLVERVTRITMLVPLTTADKTEVRKAYTLAFKELPKGLKRTLTYDQGKEMSEHELFTKQTAIKVYFAHGSSPWERGTNENTNGLVRQFFPKGTDFNKISKRQIREVQNLLNNRPRKVLNWLTPSESFINVLR